MTLDAPITTNDHRSSERHESETSAMSTTEDQNQTDPPTPQSGEGHDSGPTTNIPKHVKARAIAKAKKKSGGKAKPPSRKGSKITGLNEQQRRFIEAYTETGNATESAERAGYKGDRVILAVTGCRLLRHPRVAEAIHATGARRSEQSRLNRAARIVELERIALGDAVWKQLNPTTGKWVEGPAPPRERAKAYEMLCRMNGDFLDRVEVRDGLAALIDEVAAQEQAGEEKAEGAS